MPKIQKPSPSRAIHALVHYEGEDEPQVAVGQVLRDLGDGRIRALVYDEQAEAFDMLELNWGANPSDPSKPFSQMHWIYPPIVTEQIEVPEPGLASEE